MTLRNGLFFENNKTNQHAQDVRLMLKALLGGVTGDVAGVGGATHFKVTEKAGTPDMSVDVAAGHLFIEGSRNSAQGVYHVYNDGTVNVPLSASDPTNPRIDIVYVRVRDSAQDIAFDGEDDFEIVVAEGTPAAVPAAPTITDQDYIELARVTVGASVSAIEDADIEDTRVASSVWTRPRGYIDHKTVSSSQSGISTETDLTGLSITFTAVAGRRYRYTLMARCAITGAARALLKITDGSNTQLQGAVVDLDAAGSVTMAPTIVHSPTAGSFTVKGRARVASGPGTLTVSASDSTPMLLVEDIGGYLL